MYVGITRAQRSLQISYCTRRKRGKEHTGCAPSRFKGRREVHGLPSLDVDRPQRHAHVVFVQRLDVVATRWQPKGLLSRVANVRADRGRALVQAEGHSQDAGLLSATAAST